MAMLEASTAGPYGHGNREGTADRRSARIWRDRLHRTLLDAAIPEALFIHDHEGWFVEVNARACESLGYTRDELLDMNVVDVELEFDLPAAQAAWQRIEEGAQNVLYGRQRRKDGHVFPVKVRFGLMQVGGLRFYVGLVSDLSLTDANTSPHQPRPAAQPLSPVSDDDKQRSQLGYRVEVDSILRGLAGLVGSGPRSSETELEWSREGIGRLTTLAGPHYGRLFLDIAEALQAGLEAWLGPRDWSTSKVDIRAARSDLAASIQELAALLLGPARGD